MMANTRRLQKTQRGGQRIRQPRESAAAFTNEMLEGLKNDLAEGRLPLSRVRITDAGQVGLRAEFTQNGVTFHAEYTFGVSRPWFKIGEWPKMSIKRARELTFIIRELAAKGIDVQAAMHDRLIRELIEKGADWRPD